VARHRRNAAQRHERHNRAWHNAGRAEPRRLSESVRAIGMAGAIAIYRER